MRERGIVFSGPSIPLLLSGQKTQTRRVVDKPERLQGLMLPGEEGEWCPYGKPGDLLYVREGYQIQEYKYRRPRGRYLADDADFAPLLTHQEAARLMIRKFLYRAISGRFMPKWAARIWLEITQVRWERLQDITEVDAEAEGAESRKLWDPANPEVCPDSFRMPFADLWNALNAERDHGWGKNDPVWAITLKRVEHDT